jgi:RNA polymerase sigma factor (TIGR02999 family)
MAEAIKILTAIERGEARAAEELLPLVYEELRRLAASQLSQQPPGQTLQATALVHEAWLRLVGSDHGVTDPKWDGQRHFFGAAARAMRNILVEQARRKSRPKHGGGLHRVDAEKLELAETMPADDLLALDEALGKLEEFDAQAAELIRLRFFAGLTQQQAADLLGLSKRTADRLWTFSRAFLFKEIQGARSGAS